ncbi:hypothetical protein FQA39_LY15421 [Lamprigera yunnana]|nr:hypothetical protein FQA39_LY15421 [Lamprigera yunnana]
MCDSEPGPSSIKRPKMIVKNLKNLTKREMLYFLYNSDYDEDEHYEPDTSESEPVEDDGNKLVFSVKVMGTIHLIVPEDVHDEIMYISEMNKGELITELRIQTVSETNPEYRFQRLLRRTKFEEAEEFAKLFNLDLTQIKKAKAQLIVDQSICTESDITDLLKILDTIDDNIFKVICCLDIHLCCTTLDDVERILKYMNSICVADFDNVIQPRASQLCIRFSTFKLLMQSNFSKNKVENWYSFSDCDLLQELYILLKQKNIEEWKVICNRLDCENIQLNENVIIKTLDIINTFTMTNQIPYLNVFIPTALNFLPSAINLFINWILNNMKYIELNGHKDFPENALSFLRKMIKLLRIEPFNKLIYYQPAVAEKDSVRELVNIVKTLEKLQYLKDNYRVVLPLQPVLQYEEEYWIKIVPLILSYIDSIQKRLEVTIIIVEQANIPWCNIIRNIAMNSLNYSHPLVEKIISKINEERRAVVLRKHPYGIKKKITGDVNNFYFAINRIMYCNQSTMVEDVYQLCINSNDQIIAHNLLLHHFIKIGDFGNALKILDNNSNKVVVELWEKFLSFTVIALQYKDKQRKNYIQIIDSVFNKLQGVSKVQREMYKNNIENLRTIYYLQETFNINISYSDCNNGDCEDLFQKIILCIVNDLYSSKNILACIKECKTVASYLRVETSYVLLQLCKNINDYNIILRAASEIYESTNDSKILYEVAFFLISKVGSVNTSPKITHTLPLYEFENINVQPFLCGFTLARKIIVKAILKSSKFDLIPCMQLANWVEMTYCLIKPKTNKLWSNYDHLIGPTVSVFDAIKRVFNFYINCKNNLLISNMPDLSSSNVILKRNELVGQIHYLRTTITGLAAEGQHFVAYKLIDTLYHSLLYHKNLDKEVHESLLCILRNSVEQLLLNIFSTIALDVSLPVNLLIMFEDKTYAKGFLFDHLKRYKRNINKFKYIAEVCLLYLQYNNINDGQLLCSNILCLAKWWSRLKNCQLPYDEFFKHPPNKILTKLIKMNCISVDLISEFCEQINLNVRDCYKLHLEYLLLNWKPKYRIMINGSDKEMLIVDHDNDEYYENCIQVINLIEDEGAAVDLLKSTLKKVNFYHYEVLRCIFKLFSVLHCKTDFVEQDMILTFLTNYNRISKPGDAEKEQWFTLYPDTQCIHSFSKWRLPFTLTLMTDKIWTIIRPEINLKTYTKWFEAIPILRNLNKDDICSYVIKDVMASGLLQSEKNEKWQVQLQYKDLLNEIDTCVQNMSNLEQASSALYSLIPCMFGGADLVKITGLCLKYATKYKKQNPSSIDVEKALTKVHKKYIHFSIINILHKNNLAKKKYLDMISCHIDDLIESLYMDESILKRTEMVTMLGPDINKTVDQIGLLLDLDIEAKRYELVNNWLSIDTSMNVINLNLSNSSVHTYDSSTEYLIRASYLCTSNVNKWQEYLLSLDGGVQKSKPTAFRVMALKCFCNISSIETIEKLTKVPYEEFRKYINQLSLINGLENFGFYLEVNTLDEQNKVDILNHLSRLGYNAIAVKAMALMCMTYEIYEIKYWVMITSAMIKLKMLQELNESLLFLKKEMFYCKQWYINTWQAFIDYSFNLITCLNSTTVRKLFIKNFNTIQNCPVLFLISLEGVVKKCLELNQYDLVLLALQYLSKEKQQFYMKELIQENVCINDCITELTELGFWGIEYIKEIVSEYRSNV